MALPTAAVNFPTGQSVQESLELLDAKRPAAHVDAAHDAAPGPDHLPAGHRASHAVLPGATPKKPAAQAAHVAAATVVCAPGPKRPAEQGVPSHGRMPVLECVPD